MKLFFDTETSGMADFKAPFFAAHQPHIVQLAALLTEDDGTDLTTLDFIIKPEGFVISEEVSKIHGITQEKAMDLGVPMDFALTRFEAMLEDASQLIAHNISFDVKIMKTAYARHRSYPFQFLNTYCTMHNSTQLCKLPGKRGFKWPKLIEAHQHFFSEGFDGAHSALVDVQACKRVYFALMALENKTKEILD